MTFDAYLTDKKINSGAFQAAQPQQWQQLARVFEQVSPASFTQQKLFLINNIRRQYPL